MHLARYRYITICHCVNLSHNTAKIYSYFHVNKVTKNANSTEMPITLSRVSDEIS